MLNIYFHGTRKEILDNLLKEGLRCEYGRATLSTSPKYALSYSSSSTWGTKKKIENYSRVIKEGMLLVYNPPADQVRVAEESNLVFKKDSKIITGFPNRFKTEQFGYFPKDKSKKNLDNKYLVAVFSYTQILIDCLLELQDKIIFGELDKDYIKLSIKKIEKILSDKKLHLIKPRISFKKVATATVSGIIRNIVLREIRQSYLSIMNERGWKIKNSGGHPVKLKSLENVKCSLKNIKKFVDKNLVQKDVRKEVNKLFSWMDKNDFKFFV
jgi:hypothetical protein